MWRAASWAAAHPLGLLCPPSSARYPPCPSLRLPWDSPEPPQILAAITSTVRAVSPKLARRGRSSHPRARSLCDGSGWVPGVAWSSSVRAVLLDPILQLEKALWLDRSELRRDPGQRFLLRLCPQRWTSRSGGGWSWLLSLARRHLWKPPSWRLGVGCLEQAHVSGLRGGGAAGLCRRELLPSDLCKRSSPGRSFPQLRRSDPGAEQRRRPAAEGSSPPRSAGGARSPLGTRGKCQRPGGAAGRSQAGGAGVTQPCRRVPAAPPQDERPSPGEEARTARPAPPGGSGRCGRPGAPLLLVHPAG